MIDTYHDGSYAEARQHGPLLISRDPQTRSQIFCRTMRQLASAYVPKTQAVSATETFGGTTAYFCEETPPRDTGAGVVEFDQTFAEVPGSYIEPITIAHSYQWRVITTTFNGFIERTIPVKARCENVFGLIDYDGTMGSTFGVNIAPKYIYIPELIYVKQVGSFDYGGIDNEGFLTQDSTFERWRGPIFVRKEIFVPFIQLTDLPT